MGLFDKLLKAAKNEIVEKVTAQIEDAIHKGDSKKEYSKWESVSGRSVSGTGQDAYGFRGTAEAYFETLFARHFSEYEIRRNVTVVNTNEQNVPVSFMFMKEGCPVYAIILCHSQIYSRKRILNTMDACSRQGIPVHRFFEDFRNEETYVCDRIRSVLKL